MGNIKSVRVTGTITRGVQNVYVNEHGEIIFVMTDGAEVNVGNTGGGGGDANHYIVRFTESNGIYTADKTYEGVVAAMRTGAVVTARLQVTEETAMWFMPVAVDSSCVTFQRDWLGESSEYFRLRADNAVTRQTFQYDDTNDSTGGDLPEVTADDNYKRLLVVNGEWRKCASAPVSVTVKKENANNVVVTASYKVDDGTALGTHINSISTITLDDNGDPVAVMTDGISCGITWEGFDE